MNGAGRLSGRRAAAAAGIAALVVVSRVLARPRTFWGWDDYIFGLSLHRFAPESWVPQPPFFPAFVYAARLANLFLHDDTAALTWLSVVGGIAATAFVYGIARELGLETRVAASAAVLFAFFPAAWFYAGTPLSDTAGLAAATAAIWTSLRSRRDPRFLAAAAAILGLAIGVRPQTAFVAFFAFGFAAARRPRRPAAAALAVLALSAALFWAVPVVTAAGGVRPVARSLFGQLTYTLDVSSPLSRPRSVSFVLRRWLVDPWGSPLFAVPALAAAAIGAGAFRKRRDRDFLGFVAAGAVAYAVCAILFLDLATTGRYVLPVLPAAAVAAAAGLAAVEESVRIPRAFLTAVLVAGSVVIVGPAIRILHGRPSPPVDAAARIRAAVGGTPFAVVYPASYHVPAQVLFPGVPKFVEEKTPESDLARSPIPVWRFGVASFDTEEVSWPPLRPFLTLGPGQYMRVPYGVWKPEPEFGAGWYAEERDGDERFRWMGRSGEIRLPPCAAPARLSFSLVAPLDALGGPPAVEIAFNGRIVGRRSLAARRTELSYRFDAEAAGAPGNRLVLTTDRVFNPKRAGKSSDDRDLGLEIRRLEWGPAEGATGR